MQWSPQQQAFIDFAANDNRSCVLQAVAGAGKTTVILGAVKYMRGCTAILAYNKPVAEEIKLKLIRDEIHWKQAEAGTVHSFGFRAYRKTFNKVQLKEDKVGSIVASMIDCNHIGPALAQHASSICHLVSLAKQRAVGYLTDPNDTDVWLEICDHFDVVEDDRNVLPIIALAKEVLGVSNRKTDFIDFDDMVYLPLVYRRNVRFWQYDTVIIDEAQDTNAARRELVAALVKPRGRVFAVGDPRQAIYGFTGADNDSLDQIKNQFRCVELPLTVTFRCPKAIVQFAQQWVSHIKAHETAPEGKVSASNFEDFIKRDDLNAEAAVLCRNTKPLVKAAFALIRAKVPCRILGRDIAEGLKKLATRWKVTTLNGLESRLDEFETREKAKWIARKKENKAQEIEDKCETLRVIIDRVREEGKSDVASVVAYIDDLFADNVSGILTLSTIHKSKGREWKKVFWLDRRGTCPSRYAFQEWQRVQEVNLMYVAATRAMEELIELSPPDKVEVAKKPEPEQQPQLVAA
jgi:DNA helicase-2/ATP-dependent DNA helicase PcrA